MFSYKNYQEAVSKFDWEDRWELFEGCRQDFNIAHECVDRYKEEGKALRIKKGDGSNEIYSYNELSCLTSQFANALENIGIEEGERVAVMLHPSVEFYMCLFGTIKRGAIAVPGSPLFGPEGAKMRLSGDKALITTQNIIDNINVDVPNLFTPSKVQDLIHGEDDSYETANTVADDIAMIQYSSGTTGEPKPVEYPHKSLATAIIPAILCIGMEDDDRYFNPSPPSWGFGVWYGTICPLGMGVGVGTYSGKFQVEGILEALEDFRINNFSAVPTVLRKIIQSDIDLTDYDLEIDKLSYTGGALDKEDFIELKEKFGVPTAGMYGSTEVGVILADYLGFDDWKFKPGSLGKPLPGVRVAILDDEDNKLEPGKVGEISVKRRGEWIRVGDLGEKDEEGYFWHKRRADDVIISSGYTIGPREVEEPLKELPEVKEIVVVGIPDEERGEVVKAFIRTDLNQSDELKSKIKNFAREKISKHAYPREIEFVEDFPRTESGKIKKRELAGK